MEWPYAASGSVNSTSRLAQYGSGPSNYSNSVTQPPQAAFPGMPMVSSNRLEQGVQYNLSSMDSGFDSFTFPQSQYLPHGQDAPSVTNPYATQEIPRPWAPTGVSSRWASNGSFEQEMPSRCNAQSYQYVSPPSGAGPNPDGTLFPGLSQLAHALPDRVLPNPLGGTGPQYSDNLGAGQGSLGDSNSYLPSHSQNTRTAISWPHERLTSGGCNTALLASANSSSLANRINNSKTSTSESQDPPFGYIPVSHSPLSDNTPITSDYTTQNGNSLIGLDNQIFPKSSYGSESSSDSLLRSSNSSNNLYTYGSSNNTKRGSQSSFSGGMLANGEPYTPHIRQTPSKSLGYLIQRQDSMDQHSRTSHQTPIASVGNSRR